MTRQFLLFLFVGLLQYGIDAFLFAVLFYFGAPVAIANVLARACGAVAGFQLNGMFTFRTQRGEQGWGLAHGLRFVLLWLGMTAASTVLMLISEHLVESHDLSDGYIVGAKLLIEGALALASFALSKWWVYSH